MEFVRRLLLGNIMKINKHKNKGTIVLLHGNSSSSNVFTPVIESDIPYNIVAFDFYGHGESEHNGAYKLSCMKDQILSVLENIDDDVLLVGNSLGGHLAIEVANNVKNLKGLLFFGTPPVKKPLNMEEAFILNPAVNIFFTENPTEEEVETSLAVATQNKKVVSLLKEDFFKTDPKARGEIASQADEFSDELAILTNLICQKFIIAGEQDPFINLTYLEQNKTKANYKLIKIANCGHYPSIEQPDEFVNHLKNIANQIFSKKS